MTTFMQAPPLAQARRFADADLKGTVQPAELVWLNAHPLLWLRALISMDRDVQTHIAKDRRSIAHLKPQPGVHGGAEWLQAKADLDLRSRNRLHFQAKVRNRIEEVKSILGPEPATGRLSVGDLITLMAEIAYLIDTGDEIGAREKAEHWAKVWAQGAASRTEAA